MSRSGLVRVQAAAVTETMDARHHCRLIAPLGIVLKMYFDPVNFSILEIKKLNNYMVRLRRQISVSSIGCVSAAWVWC